MNPTNGQEGKLGAVWERDQTAKTLFEASGGTDESLTQIESPLCD